MALKSDEETVISSGKDAKKVHEEAIKISNSIPEHAFGALGNQGFFDKFKVTFDYKKKEIEVI